VTRPVDPRDRRSRGARREIRGVGHRQHPPGPRLGRFWRRASSTTMTPSRRGFHAADSRPSGEADGASGRWRSSTRRSTPQASRAWIPDGRRIGRPYVNGSTPSRPTTISMFRSRGRDRPRLPRPLVLRSSGTAKQRLG
jgi:hypothetical protein